MRKEKKKKNKRENILGLINQNLQTGAERGIFVWRRTYAKN
jgi:hypothetical protein